MELTDAEVLDLLVAAYPKHSSVIRWLGDRIEYLKEELSIAANQGYEILDLRSDIEELKAENERLSRERDLNDTKSLGR